MIARGTLNMKEYTTKEMLHILFVSVGGVILFHIASDPNLNVAFRIIMGIGCGIAFFSVIISFLYWLGGIKESHLKKIGSFIARFISKK